MNKPDRTTWRATQTTIDLDNPTGLRVLMVWHNLQKLGAIEGRISASGNGVHIRCKTNRPLTLSEVLLIRQQHADDVQRIHYDTTAPESKPLMILFDKKRGMSADDWLTDPIRLIDRYGAMI